jgi:hypothetical protein
MAISMHGIMLDKSYVLRGYWMMNFFFFLGSYTGVQSVDMIIFEFGVCNLGLCLFWAFLF